MSWKALAPPLRAIPVVPKAFWRVHVDVLGPFEMSLNGHGYVALGVCALTKYVEAEGKYHINNFSCRYSLVDPNSPKQGGGVMTTV